MMAGKNENYFNQSQKRTHLPAKRVNNNEIGLWSILKHCIGKELSKITMPVLWNEPLSFTQRVTENFQYIQLLSSAAATDDPLRRMELVAAFAVSAYSYNWQRLLKPFNPLLGETYELICEKGGGFRSIAEQVSHHPPITAFHCQSEAYEIHGSINPQLRFWGRSIEVKPEGSMTLRLGDEIYTWKHVNCCVHNIIVGTLWFEQYGLMEIKNHRNGIRASLNFKAAGWFGRDLHRLDGFIYSKEGEKLRFLYGKWTEYLKSAAVDDYDEYMKENSDKFQVPDKPLDNRTSSGIPSKMLSKLSNSFTKSLGNNSSLDEDPLSIDNGEIPKSDSANSLDIPNSVLLWIVEPRPEHSPDYYNFTFFSMILNEFPREMEETLPRTDSRWRPDVRHLEEGNLDASASEKSRLEEKQREVRRIRKKKKENWIPVWFKYAENPFSKEKDWLFTGEYWSRNFSNCPDIF